MLKQIVDANGNVGQLVDASNGTIAAHYEYDPFGKLLVATGSEADSNVFRFSTKYFDMEVGLYDYGLRYYSPELGRWTMRDLLGEEGGLNLYVFAGNDPVNEIDLLGLRWDIFREYGSKAEAICCNDTVDALGRKIGLDANDYRNWLTPASAGPLPRVSSQKIRSRRFYIPNTVSAYWAGHFSWLGRWHISWNESISYLRDLGFLVLESRHVHGAGDYLEQELIRLANMKYLHGLYFWGHGSRGYGLNVAQKNAVGLINQLTWEDVLVYSSARRDLPYRMALGLIFACFSNTGRADLYSNAPGGIWHGYDGILKPIGPFHVKHWISPGDQETRTDQ